MTSGVVGVVVKLRTWPWVVTASLVVSRRA
jgi:hypothetical protein